MKVLITGGCGFIGCNSAKRLAEHGHEITLLDDLSRRGTERNLEWLRSQGIGQFVRGDVRDAGFMHETLQRTQFDVILHLAAQVAVTTSVVDPRNDFDINALGTFNLLEAVRRFNPDAVVIYSSTNKVYGHLGELEVREEATRYVLPGLPRGVSERQPLDFHSPYGCSKGSADQYVIDYSRIYGLRTASLRQSCIYGYRQFGIEDQGWLAWFTIAHLLGRDITIYGSGKQVRDLLFIDDLVDCYLACIERIAEASGKAYNIGGGPTNTLSVLEFMDLLGELSGRPVEFTFGDWRPGDQPVYVSDVRKAEDDLGWRPHVGVRAGVERLYSWVEANLETVGAGLRV